MEVGGQWNEFEKALHKLVWTILMALNGNSLVLLLSFHSKSVYSLAEIFYRTLRPSPLKYYPCNANRPLHSICLHIFYATKETTDGSAAPSTTDH